ncbi:SRPBCC domain-containing protein [bacterium]|nr:SRPBCC domain-containing protein [bacterium]
MSTFNHSRKIEAAPEKVFAAISNPQRLAKWWGPAGFTNTFEVCDFKVGGSWIYTMHGPDGKDYANHSVFTKIETNKKIVIQHESLPKYTLTISLAPHERSTLVNWSQTFEKPEIAKAIAHIVVPANEQNLDRWTQEVLMI